MSSPEHRLDRSLHEALALERTLITTLEAHLVQTPPGTYRRLLERHLQETRAHALALSSRLERSNHLAGAALGLAHTALGHALALVKTPLNLLRGATDTRETMLSNAKDECASEALEIATYDAIEALAEAVGDDEVAALARAHRQDEERMLADLRALIPTLTVGRAGRPALPIAGYDDLNAGQVTARLGELSQADLRTVLEYERAHRNRRSVVERAGQLTAEPPWPGYDRDDTATILARLTAEDAGAVRDYESRHRRRVAILEAAQQALAN